MIWGIITAILFIITAGRFITKRWIKSANKFMGKIHKIVGLMLIVMVADHIIMTWSLRKQRPVEIYISGAVMLICSIVAVVSWACRRKLGVQWIKIHRATAIIILLCLIFHVYEGISSLSEYKKSVADITVHNIDVKGIADGTYTGDCNVGYIYAKVQVKVENGSITSVELLEHRTERGQNAESIVDNVVKEQKIDVDTVSGATNSSKVILKAVENALKGEKSNE